MTPATTRSIRTQILKWYDANGRDLPWRQKNDPYATWVSEIMLQQTRVDTVLKFYEPFLARFPDLQTLADANEEDVLEAWSGLGYYRRARLLQRGVREVVQNYGGVIPRDAKTRLALPGIGPYTSGAIGSIAFEQEEALVDGNVMRVLARLFLIRDEISTAVAKREFWSRAKQLVLGERPGDFNQGLMELGALICTPRAAKCGQCPVQHLCGAFESGEVAELPNKKRKKPPKEVYLTSYICQRDDDAIAMIKSDQALYGGLWNLPTFEISETQDSRFQLEELGLDISQISEAKTLKHQLTHRTLQLRIHQAKIENIHSDSLKFFSAEKIQSMAISTLTRKTLALFLSPSIDV